MQCVFSLIPAPVTAIFYIGPNLFPFLAPGKGPATNSAVLLGQISFFDFFHL
jgi:hypothetical protein